MQFSLNLTEIKLNFQDTEFNIKNDNEKEREFEKLWNFIFSILNNKELIKKMKNSDIELI